MMKDIEAEKREAINAGRRAISSLKDADDMLRKAKNWGIWDLFGEDGIVTFFKHSRINDAKRYIDKAYKDILRFERELKDVCLDLDLNVDISTLLTVADFFWDGVIADYLVQRQINQARDKIREAIRIIEKLLRELRYI